MKLNRRTQKEIVSFEEKIKWPKCFVCGEPIDENRGDDYILLTGDLKRHVDCAPGSKSYAKKFNGQYQSAYCKGIKMKIDD